MREGNNLCIFYEIGGEDQDLELSIYSKWVINKMK